MAGRIYVVYARAATGLKEWPIAAFFNSTTAAEDAAAFAKAAAENGHIIVTSSGRGRVTKALVRDYATWASVPALSKGF